MRSHATILSVLKAIYGKNFKPKQLTAETALPFFLSHPHTLDDLHVVFRFLLQQETHLPHPDQPGRLVRLPASTVFGSVKAKRAIMLIAQVHGNEPIGLSSILYAMVLSSAGLLNAKVYAAIGNRPAASFFWEAYQDSPEAPAHTRARTRTLVGEDDKIDLNRFLPQRGVEARENRSAFIEKMLQSDNVMLRRGAKLVVMACQPEIELIFDPHTSRQEPDGIRTINISALQMERLEKGVKPHGGLLRGVPEDIRVFPAGLLGKLGSTTPKITLKELFEAALQDKVIPIIGIECGHHENIPDVLPRCVNFFNALIYNLKLCTIVPPLHASDSGIFYKHYVRGRLNLDFLSGKIVAGDAVYPVQALNKTGELPDGCNKVIVSEASGGCHIMDLTQPGNSRALKIKIDAGETVYAIYQFREMEDIAANQTVMVGVPSGSVFKAPEKFTVIFPSKSSEIYGQQAGMWPILVGDNVEVSKNAKFGYGIFDKEQIKLPLQ